MAIMWCFRVCFICYAPFVWFRGPATGSLSIYTGNHNTIYSSSLWALLPRNHRGIKMNALYLPPLPLVCTKEP